MLNKKMFILLYFLVFTKINFGEYPSFLYPVGPVIFEQSKRLCVLYQKGPHLELLLWDPVTKKAIRGLSHQTPTGLTILPSKLAFSFIDHERVRIKSLSKKSSKSLDLHPLYDFNLINWIDDENYYCSAREGRNYNLFHVTIFGDFFKLTYAPFCEYTYPQKVKELLFYIKKDAQGVYTIEKTDYPTQVIKECEKRLLLFDNTLCENDYEQLSETIQLNPSEILVTNKDDATSFSFLSMSSELEGFFLKHADYPFLERTTKLMTFECWHLIKEKHDWETKKLFTFYIPLDFLYGEKRLCEAIFRLVPYYYQNTLFYVSADQTGYLDVYRYNIMNKTITCYRHEDQKDVAHYYFTPIIYQGNALLGGMITDNDNSEESPTLNLDVHGTYNITFPIISALDLIED